MSETVVPVAEAAKDFLRLLDWVERQHESAILMREGRPVATLSPLPSAALTCAELADRWPKLDKLSSDEANAFVDDLEHARASLPLGLAERKGLIAITALPTSSIVRP